MTLRMSKMGGDVGDVSVAVLNVMSDARLGPDK